MSKIQQKPIGIIFLYVPNTYYTFAICSCSIYSLFSLYPKDHNQYKNIGSNCRQLQQFKHRLLYLLYLVTTHLSCWEGKEREKG